MLELHTHSRVVGRNLSPCIEIDAYLFQIFVTDDGLQLLHCDTLARQNLKHSHFFRFGESELVNEPFQVKSADRHQKQLKNWPAFQKQKNERRISMGKKFKFQVVRGLGLRSF